MKTRQQQSSVSEWIWKTVPHDSSSSTNERTLCATKIKAHLAYYDGQSGDVDVLVRQQPAGTDETDIVVPGHVGDEWADS